jgi:hypothetical protein
MVELSMGAPTTATSPLISTLQPARSPMRAWLPTSCASRVQTPLTRLNVHAATAECPEVLSYLAPAMMVSPSMATADPRPLRRPKGSARTIASEKPFKVRG